MEVRSKIEPTFFTIFGAVGDLSKKKLIPALFHLWKNGFLPEKFKILGVARESLDNHGFRNFIEKVLQKHGITEKKVNAFLECAFYISGTFEDKTTYANISKLLASFEKEFRTCANKLFYLAAPPPTYKILFKSIAKSGLSIPCSNENGWARILVEKPFGKNLKTARELDQLLGRLFQEEQIFRIDHYLAKETVQNILAFRFSNALFEPIWRKEYIEKVEIKLWETIGIGDRGNFYEGEGALRDVGQNHLLQLLALTTMENPKKYDANSIREKRAQTLAHLKLLTNEEIKKNVVRGQYKGYRAKKNVNANSRVETYFRFKTFIDNDRWRNIPFYLESGKKLKEKKTEITVHFKQNETCLCPPDKEHKHRNFLAFRIQPDEGISIGFWIKKPGFSMELEPKNLSFLYTDGKDSAKLPDAYERVLFACIQGDQTLFTSTKEGQAAWRFITPILENWNSNQLHEYKPGSRPIEIGKN
jgi:glucose-6-phosphate 1-dehydrogenase